MYYPCSENKGADQLRGYREADLRLCFCICKLLVFSCTGSYYRDVFGWDIKHKICQSDKYNFQFGVPVNYMGRSHFMSLLMHIYSHKTKFPTVYQMTCVLK